MQTETFIYHSKVTTKLCRIEISLECAEGLPFSNQLCSLQPFINAHLKPSAANEIDGRFTRIMPLAIREVDLQCSTPIENAERV